MKIEPILIPFILFGTGAGYLIARHNEKIAILGKRHLLNFVMLLSVTLVSYIILHSTVEDILRNRPPKIEEILSDSGNPYAYNNPRKSEKKVVTETRELFIGLIIFGYVGIILRAKIRNEETCSPIVRSRSHKSKTPRNKITPYEFGRKLYRDIMSDKWDAYMADLSLLGNVNFSKMNDAERIAYLKEFRLFLSSLIAGVVQSKFEPETRSSIMHGFEGSFFGSSEKILSFHLRQQFKDVLIDRCNTYLPIFQASMRESRNAVDLALVNGLGGVFLGKAFGQDDDSHDLSFLSETQLYLSTFYSMIPQAINELLTSFEVTYVDLANI